MLRCFYSRFHAPAPYLFFAEVYRNGPSHGYEARRIAENRRTPDEFHQPSHKPVDAPTPGSHP
jgi:hypothetical protein